MFSRTNGLLLFIAFLWGVSFVFQRAGMDHMGPLTFNAYRFIIAVLVLLPLVLKNGLLADLKSANAVSIKGGILAGGVLFFGALFQQYSIQYTAVANVGFITGLYVVIVPLLGIFLGHRYQKWTWFGAAIACYGLYLLSGFEGGFSNIGDILALIGALFWALHILVLSTLVNKSDPYLMAFIQFFVCGVLSLLAALAIEDNLLAIGFWGAIWVLASGVIATALGYTLQIIAQSKAAPFNAAIILGLEAVFAALAGYLVFHELLSVTEVVGCFLMFSGCILAQYTNESPKATNI